MGCVPCSVLPKPWETLDICGLCGFSDSHLTRAQHGEALMGVRGCAPGLLAPLFGKQRYVCREAGPLGGCPGDSVGPRADLLRQLQVWPRADPRVLPAPPSWSLLSLVSGLLARGFRFLVYKSGMWRLACGVQ